MELTRFEWDDEKDRQNQVKHGISFGVAQYAFADRNRVILEDTTHSDTELRYYCMGKVGEGVLTVRFSHRENVIRIIGAGYWRRGRKLYETRNTLHE